MRGATPNFLVRVRRPDSDIRQMVEAIAVATNGNGTPQDAVKKINADFAAADALTGLANLGSPNDGVQLAEVATTILDHSTVTGANYAAQLNKGAASFQCAKLLLLDSNSAQVEISSVTARLNPANGGSQQVAFWNCQLFSAFEISGSIPGGFASTTLVGVVPICDPFPVAAPNSEGDVVFSWAGNPKKPRPKIVHPPAGFAGVGATPVLYVMIWGTKADGSVAANVGWACEAVGSFSQNNDQLTLVALTQATPPQSGFAGIPQPVAGSTWWQTLQSTTQTPRLKLVYNTGVAATITFTTTKCDLGGVPSATVEFTGKGETPAGASIVYQVQADDATWLTFTDGQTTDDLNAANPAHTTTKRQTYAVRATLNPSASSDATPTLRAIGVRALTRTDLSEVAEVTGGDVHVDPITLKSSIPQARLQALRDGDPDYRDAISTLVATTPAGSLEIRVYRGGRRLARGDWLLQRTFLVDDVVCPGASVELSLISPLALLRAQLPVYNAGTGLRKPLPYAGFSIASAFADIRDGQIALPARYRGSGVADTTVVGKLIPPNAQAVVSSYALLRSALVRNLLDQQSWQTVQGKDELDNLAFLAGDAVIESQGLVKAVNMCEGSLTPHNAVLFPRDLTNAAWTKTSCTPALDQPGALDGLANTASSLIATGANATCLQAITVVSSARNETAYVKRLIGTGEIDMTMDGGTTWRNVTAQITSTGYTKIQIPSQTLASLSVGFRLVTNGDKIAVDLVDNDDGAAFTLTPESLAASFTADEILWSRVTPGFAQRVPEVYCPWSWNQTAQRLEFEYRAFNGPALTNLGIARIDSVSILPTDMGQWITADGSNGASPPQPTSSLAQRTAVRQATLLGGGLLEWEFETTYEYPELEEGDLVAIPTAYFVANSPITSLPISGWLMATGKVVGTDLSGRKFQVWIRRWNDLVPANALVPRQNFAAPVVKALHAFVDEAGECWVNAVCQDAKGIKVAASTAAMPSDTTTRAATAQALDTNLQLAGFDTGINAGAAGATLYVKAFAYENADGSGNESIAQVAQILFPKRRRAHLLDDNRYALRATKSDGSTDKSDAYSPQGSMQPVPNNGIQSGLQWFTNAGNGGSTRWIAINCPPAGKFLYRPDGSTIAIDPWGPAALTPSLSQVAGGALAARTRFVRIYLMKDGLLYQGTYAGGTANEASLAVSANNLLQVASPTAVAGFDGWAVLVSATSNTECSQGGNEFTALPFGTPWTEPVGGASISGRVLYSSLWNTQGTGGIIFLDAASSTTYYWYLAYDLAMGMVRAINPSGNGSVYSKSAADAVFASAQNGDGLIPLSYGAMTTTTPGDGNATSGNLIATTNTSANIYL